MSVVTLSESKLMFIENLIKITIHLIKHTPLTNFRENGKGTNRTIIFDIKFALLFPNGKMLAFLNSERKIELKNKLLKR